MKTYKEQTQEIIKENNLKSIFNLLESICLCGNTNNKGYELVKMIVENSNDFTKNIGEKWLEQYNNCPCDSENEDGSPSEYVSMLSEKQKWCLVYQVKNNINVYLS